MVLYALRASKALNLEIGKMGLEPPIKIIPHPEILEKAEALLMAGIMDNKYFERLEEMKMSEVQQIIKNIKQSGRKAKKS